MTATAADYAAGTRDATILNWASAAIQMRYPNARDNAVTPAEGFFDTAADAQRALEMRSGLIGTERRRFAVKIADTIWLDPTGGIPVVTLVDSEQGVSADFIVARYEVDLETETTTLELFG